VGQQAGKYGVNGVGVGTGSWLVPANEVRGLTPAQIQQKLALDKPPTHMVDVTVPVGTKLEISVAGPQQTFGMQGGEQQINITLASSALTEMQYKAMFSNPRKFP
jgi:hypothetical protein